MSAEKWTAKQRENAMTYGICRICHMPREAKMTDETDAAGNRTVTTGIVCPNGHKGW